MDVKAYQALDDEAAAQRIVERMSKHGAVFGYCRVREWNEWLPDRQLRTEARFVVYQEVKP